ncbi:MAG: hypothetical protein CL912_28500 [Deltaproteobacteria bacterium]|nr:hypothetical protein [Deltaproteobacteria bacterium]
MVFKHIALSILDKNKAEGRVEYSEEEKAQIALANTVQEEQTETGIKTRLEKTTQVDGGEFEEGEIMEGRGGFQTGYGGHSVQQIKYAYEEESETVGMLDADWVNPFKEDFGEEDMDFSGGGGDEEMVDARSDDGGNLSSFGIEDSVVVGHSAIGRVCSYQDWTGNRVDR